MLIRLTSTSFHLTLKRGRGESNHLFMNKYEQIANYILESYQLIQRFLYKLFNPKVSFKVICKGLNPSTTMEPHLCPPKKRIVKGE